MGRAAETETRRQARARAPWPEWPDAALLERPIKSLKVSIRGTWLASCVDALQHELAARDILVRPHTWLSDEWFSPQHTPGIAIPFYLAHPRLMRLERKMMLEVEGGARADCMRLLRHEAGHVVQYSFGLHRRRKWQQLFGRATEKYPDRYRANPGSKKHVQHLRRWYAQAHPDEDFAETFAVWLTPRSGWRKRYADWPAIAKLEYVDELMREIAGERPAARQRVEIEPVRELKATLGEYYDAKRRRYAIDTPTVFDRDLTRIFSTEARHRKAPSAASVMRRHRTTLIRAAAKRTGDYPIALDAAVDDLIRRSQALALRAPGSESALKQNLIRLLSSNAAHAHYSTTRRRLFAV